MGKGKTVRKYLRATRLESFFQRTRGKSCRVFFYPAIMPAGEKNNGAQGNENVARIVHTGISDTCAFRIFTGTRTELALINFIRLRSLSAVRPGVSSAL